MNTMLRTLCVTVGTLAFATMVGGAEANPQACQQVMKNSCTKCHDIKRICNTLGKADADWPAIVADMGKRGKLGQEIQDQAISCLTSTDEAVRGTLCLKK